MNTDWQTIATELATVTDPATYEAAKTEAAKIADTTTAAYWRTIVLLIAN